MDDTTTAAEGPAKLDCAWCARCFANVLDLLDHVEASHLDDVQAA